MHFSEAAFLGTTRIDDPAGHRAYNEWHQLDHRPENLLLDKVAWGERWVRSPDCCDLTAAAVAEWDDFHYLNSYWFRSPVEAAIAEWAALADRSFHWGRRPDLLVASRPFMGFFRPMLGRVAPRALVSAGALPLRPNRGVYLTVTRSAAVADRDRAELHACYEWYAREGFERLLRTEGIAGVWALATAADLAPAAWAQQEGSQREAAGTLRIHLYFCDNDPLEVAAEIAEAGVKGTVLAPSNSVEELLFAGPLRAIAPWEWDWFDAL